MTKFKEMKARFDGTCQHCGKPIKAGEIIYWRKLGKGRGRLVAIHQMCHIANGMAEPTAVPTMVGPRTMPPLPPRPNGTLINNSAFFDDDAELPDEKFLDETLNTEPIPEDTNSAARPTVDVERLMRNALRSRGLV